MYYDDIVDVRSEESDLITNAISQKAEQIIDLLLTKEQRENLMEDDPIVWDNLRDMLASFLAEQFPNFLLLKSRMDMLKMLPSG